MSLRIINYLIPVWNVFYMLREKKKYLGDLVELETLQFRLSETEKMLSRFDRRINPCQHNMNTLLSEIALDFFNPEKEKKFMDKLTAFGNLKRKPLSYWKFLFFSKKEREEFLLHLQALKALKINYITSKLHIEENIAQRNRIIIQDPAVAREFEKQAEDIARRFFGITSEGNNRFFRS